MNEAPLLSAWLDLFNATLRSGQAVQQVWEQLAQQPEVEKALRGWWSQTYPQADPPPAGGFPDSAAQQVWLEQWQKTMGIVPRRRYLDLLEENDALRRQLRDAAATIERLRTQQPGDPSAAAEAAGNVLNQMFQETMKTQAEWLKRWSAGTAGGDPEPDPPEAAK